MESTNIYTQNFKVVSYHLPVFSGKDYEANLERGLAHNVVMSLVSGLSRKGYHIYTDNFYTSPELFLDLCDKACGTVCTNRKELQNNSNQRVQLEL